MFNSWGWFSFSSLLTQQSFTFQAAGRMQQCGKWYTHTHTLTQSHTLSQFFFSCSGEEFIVHAVLLFPPSKSIKHYNDINSAETISQLIFGFLLYVRVSLLFSVLCFYKLSVFRVWTVRKHSEVISSHLGNCERYFSLFSVSGANMHHEIIWVCLLSDILYCFD